MYTCICIFSRHFHSQFLLPVPLAATFTYMYTCMYICSRHFHSQPRRYVHIHIHACAPFTPMGWLRLVGSLKLQVPFAKEPYERDDILQKRPIILRSLLIVATPYTVSTPLVSLSFSLSPSLSLSRETGAWQQAPVALCLSLSRLTVESERAREIEKRERERESERERERAREWESERARGWARERERERDAPWHVGVRTNL